MKGVTSRDTVFTAESFIRAESKEFVDGMIFAGISASVASVGFPQFSIQTPVLEEEARKILNTPRILLQNTDHLFRRFVIRFRIVNEDGTVN